MDYPVTMQEALREVLERRFKRLKREGLAKALGMTPSGADYLRSGGKMVDGKWENRFIKLEHLESLARSENIGFGDILEELAVTMKTMETMSDPKRRPVASEAPASQPQPPESDSDR